MLTLSQWAASVDGRYIDTDRSFGGQCWDLAQDYVTRCINPDLTLYTQPAAHAGFAIGTWETVLANTWAGEQIRESFDARTGDEIARPGDIIIWHWGQLHYPMSHIAVVLEDRGDYVLCMSQNSSPARPDLPGYSPEASGPASRQLLPKLGIAGYLRPLATGIKPSGSVKAPAEEKDWLDVKTDAQIKALVAQGVADALKTKSTRDNLRQIVWAIDGGKRNGKQVTMWRDSVDTNTIVRNLLALVTAQGALLKTVSAKQGLKEADVVKVLDAAAAKALSNISLRFDSDDKE